MPEEAKIDERSEAKAKAIEEGSAQIGHNSMNQVEFLSYMARHSAIEDQQEKLRKARNLMRRNMKNAGIDCALFDTVRKEMDLSPEVLAANQAKISNYRYMSGLAPNEQGDFLEAQEAVAKQTDQERLNSIEEGAYIDSISGRGKTSDENPHDPGTPAAEHWHDGWMRGQKALAKQLKADGVSIDQ